MTCFCLLIASIPKKEKKKNPLALKRLPQKVLDLVQSGLLLTAHACPFMIVIGTNAILCPEIFYVT